MDIKEYFEQTFILDKEVKVLKERIIKLRDFSVDVGSVLLCDRVTGGKNVDKIGDIVVKISEMENMYVEKTVKLLKIKYEIQKIIDEMDRNEYRLIMELRYLDFYTWEKIAEIMNYSVRNVHNVHKKALSIVPDNLAV